MSQASPELFDFLSRPPAYKHCVRIIFGWLAQKREQFFFFIVLSFFAHLALLSCIAIFGSAGGSPPSPAASQGRDFEAFRRSLQEFTASRIDSDKLAKALITVTDQDLYEAFLKAPKLDDRLSDREKNSIYKMMVSETLANYRERTGDRSALDVPFSQYLRGLRELPMVDSAEDFILIPIKDTLSGVSQLFKLSKERAQELQTLTIATKPAKIRSGDVTIQNNEGRISHVPWEYFSRDSPYQQLLAIGAQLFYIVKGFPELTAFETQTNSAPSETEGSLPDHPEKVPPNEPKPSFKVVFMPNYRPLDSKQLAKTARRPLVLSPENVDRILDGLMAFPDDEQVRLFNRDYLQVYDPDSPALTRLAQEFIYRNLGMVFLMTDPLSRGFDFLEEVYYDNISQDELVTYWMKNRRSRTGAEILFGLAASYEFERRAIIALDESLDSVKSVLAHPSDDRFFVYNRSAKSYVLREVYRDLAAELRRREFTSLESVLQKYKDEQIKIYNLLIEMGGDLKSRALYALADFYWDEGQAGLALKTWKEIDPAFSTGTLNKIRNIMANGMASTYVISRIDDILAAEAAADANRLLDKLEYFHKWETRSLQVRGGKKNGFPSINFFHAT